MKVHAAFLGVLTLSATLGLVVAQDRPASEPAPATPGGGTAAPRERDADIRAIGDLVASFVKEYNAKDAKALGALFTPDAEIEDEGGDVTRGRDAIVERFSKTFAGSEAGKLAVNSESLRFLGSDVAIEEGTASLSTGSDGPSNANRYSVIYARQDGRWLQARIRDEPNDGVSSHERLLELGWMLGDWVNESDDAVVATTCKWSDEGNFLLREFDVKAEGRITLRGTQRIGWDPQKEQFRVWTFDDNGGFAEGTLTGEGDRWMVKGSGVRSDGQSVSFTNVITILGKDRLRWETFDRTLGGELVPGTERFFLVRPAPSPGK